MTNIQKQHSFALVPKATIERAISIIDELAAGESSRSSYTKYRISRGNETFTHESVDEWYADYVPGGQQASLSHDKGAYRLSFLQYGHADGGIHVDIDAPTRAEATRLMQVFRDALDDPANQIPRPTTTSPSLRVFLGHGHSSDWRTIKDELQDKHHIDVEAYETGSRSGHTIKDVLDSMLNTSTMAFLIMSGDDTVKQDDQTATTRARQNVVHEAGLFQGRLGFHRAIAVVENGLDVFSNIDGVQQIRYDKGNVKSALSDILAVIRREFPTF